MVHAAWCGVMHGVRVSVACRARLPEPVDRAADAPADENCGKRAVQAPVEERTLPQAFPKNAVPGIKGYA